MGSATEIISLIRTRQDVSQFQRLNWKGIFEDYLDVVARNQRVAGIEVDVIADDGAARVLVEVKFRARGDYGGAALAIAREQSRRLVHAARVTAAEAGRPVRIDVVALELTDDGLTLRHIRNAIEDTS